MLRDKHYDIFLIHNNSDKPTVERLARKLRASGFEPFLDKWHLIPGNPWQEALEEALDQSRTCAVILGSAGVSPWENEEMRAALERRIHSPDFRVIPVLLPGASLPKRGRLPRFLSRLTWVDFRLGLEDEEAFLRLTCGIRGVAPVPAFKSDDWDEGVCPYRGLQSFDEEHAGFFFGRDVLIQRMIEDLREASFLAVAGPSGSGKSSVVRAGLIPAVRRGVLPSSERWKVVLITPGPRPLEELAFHVLQLLPSLGGQVDIALRIENSLTTDKRALHASLRIALRDEDPAVRVLFVVDQFEELFTLCEDEKQRVSFLDNLLYASGILRGRAVVVLTLRTDFFSHVAAYSELADRVADYQIVVSHLEESEFREAIEEPAGQVGLEFDEGLVEKILGDVSGQPAGLPLLQFALLELWEKRLGRRMTHGAYSEIGGVEGAITRRAEREYDELSADHQPIARRALLRLVQPGEGTEDTLRRAPLSELVPVLGEASEVDSVILKLVGARLLTTSRDASSGRQTIVLAHEALIKGWPRLREWIEDERSGLSTQRRLTARAEEWRSLNRDDGALLRGALLLETSEWAGSRLHEMTVLERDFLEASEARKARKDQERRNRHSRELETAQELARTEALARRTIRRRAQWLSLVTILAVVACGLTILMWRTADEERRNRASRELASKALRALDQENPERSLLLSLEALNALKDPGQRTSPAAETALRRALAATTGIGLPSPYQAKSIALSPSGKWLAVGGGSIDSIVLWDLEADVLVPVYLDGYSPAHGGVVFYPDSKVLAGGCESSSICLWNLEPGKLSESRRVLGTHPDELTSLTVSHSKPYVLASASTDGSIQVWNLTNEGGIPEFVFQADLFQAVPGKSYARSWSRLVGGTVYGGGTGVMGLHLSPDASLLVAESMLGVGRWPFRSQVWSMADGQYSEQTLPMAGPRISTNGRWLAGSVAGVLELWELEVPSRRSGPGDWLGSHYVYSEASAVEAFTKDGQWLLTRAGAMVELWRHRQGEWFQANLGLDDDPEETRLLYNGMFSPNGRWLAVAEHDGSSLIWNLNVKERPERLRLRGRHEGKGVQFKFSQNGRRLFMLSVDGELSSWNLSAEQGVEFERVFTTPLTDGPEITKDGDWLVGIGHEGVVRLLPEDGQEGSVEPKILGGFDSSVSAMVTSSDKRWLALWKKEEEITEILQADPLLLPGAHGRLVTVQTQEQPRALGSTGRWLVAGGTGTPLNVWHTSNLSRPNRALSDGAVMATAVVFDSEDRKLAVADNLGQIKVWTRNTSSWDEISTVTSPGRSKEILFSPDGGFLAVASLDDFSMEVELDIRVWELGQGNSGLAKSPVLLAGHLSPVAAMAVSSDSRLMATGDRGGSVLLWRRPFLESATRLRVAGAQDSGSVRLLEFSDDNRWLFAGWQGSVDGATSVLWDLKSREPTKAFVFSGDLLEEVTAAAFDASGSYIAVGDETGALHLWRLAKGKPATEALSLGYSGEGYGILEIAWSRDGKFLTSLANHGTIRRWSLDLSEVIEQGCRLAGRNLTSLEWRNVFANEDYRKTCLSIPIHPSLIADARELIRLGFHEKAFEAFDLLARLEPDLKFDPQGEIQVAEIAQAVREGGVLARQGKLRQAAEKFKGAYALDSASKLDPLEEARRLVAEAQFWKAREEIQRGGDLEKVVTFLKESLSARGEPWPEVFLEEEGWSDIARALHNLGHRLTKLGRFEKARTALLAAELMDPRVRINPVDFNDICWFGSLWGHADEVLVDCERAVQLEPENGVYRDSRGLARALTGDRSGAIEDFDRFVELAAENKAISASLIEQRVEWIADLEKGGQPLTDDVLIALREQSSGQHDIANRSESQQ